MFGGFGVDNIGLECYLDDLWEYNASTNQWAWMDGHSTCYEWTTGYQGIYGEVGATRCRKPSLELHAIFHMDRQRRASLALRRHRRRRYRCRSPIEMICGEFYPSLDEWAFTSTSSGGAPGGSTSERRRRDGEVFRPRTYLDSAQLLAASWIDSGGNFWVLGQLGVGERVPRYTRLWLNDLWEFNPSINEWRWISGSSSIPFMSWGAPGQYGTQGTPAPGNTPGGRHAAAAWTDASGNLWLFGGAAVDANGTQGSLNDLWEYDLAGTPPVRPPSPAPTPTFSLAAGSYNSAQTVTISDQTAGATIYYTTNGTTPNANSPIYGAPIQVPTTETVEAVAVATGNAVSAIASATYTINLPPAATPAFSCPQGRTCRRRQSPSAIRRRARQSTTPPTEQRRR